MADNGKVEFICGGCGKREAGYFDRMGNAHKPHVWYQRSDDDGTQMACSRSCIDTIASVSSKTSCVIPI